MRKTLLLTVGCLLGIWTFCPAQEQTDETAVVQNVATASESSSYTGSDRYTSSPQTWSIMKYGGTTPNLYTGTVSTNIPVYTYQDDDFTIPVSLSYASNGYTPNVVANFVGLGWALNAGGQIFQTVNCMPDTEMYDFLMGYIKHTEDDKTNTLIDLDPAAIDLSHHMYSPWLRGNWYIETEPDIFSFNFLGHVGKFMVVGKNIRVFDSNYPSGEYSVRFEDGSTPRFRITTGNGYSYVFEDLNRSDDKIASYTRYLKSGWSSLRFDSQNLSATWHLVEAIAPNGRTVTFSYVKSKVETYRPKDTQEITYRNDYRGANIPDLDYKKTGQDLILIDKIDIDGGVEIDFKYGSRLSELAVNKELVTSGSKLESILVSLTSKTGDKHILRECSLEYSYNTGERADKSNRIMFLNSVRLSGSGIYRMDYYGIDKDFPYHQTSDLDHWGYYNAGYNDRPVTSDPDDYRHIGDLRPTLLPEVDDFAEYNWTLIASRKPNADFACRGLLSQITYPTGGYTTFEYEPHQYKDMVTRDSSSDNLPYLKIGSSTFTTGGLRIKKITDHPLTGTPNTRSYLYLTADGKSSGNLLIHPYYYFHMDEYNRTTGVRNEQDIWLANYANSDASESHIEYERVMEVYTDGSHTVYNFANYHDYPDRVRSRRDSLVNPETYAANAYRVNNFLTQPDYEPSFRGHLLMTSYYNDQSQLVKRIVNTYNTLKERRFIESVRYAADQFYIHRSYLESYPLLSQQTTIYVPGETQSLTTKQSYSYNSLGQLTGIVQLESDGSEIRDSILYVSDLAPAQRTSVHTAMLARNVLDLPIKRFKTTRQTSTIPGRPGTLIELLTAADEFEYILVGDSIVRPLCQRRARIDKPVGLTTTPEYDLVISYDHYDSEGRLLQSTDQTGVSTSYVWGYDGLYPVAQVVGAHYTTIQPIIGRTTPFSISLSEAQESELRALSNVLVTTYKYKPHVGPTRITDPSGRSRCFSYDEYGRLASELDDQYRTVRSYNYHFIYE